MTPDSEHMTVLRDRHGGVPKCPPWRCRLGWHAWNPWTAKAATAPDSWHSETRRCARCAKDERRWMP